MRLKFYFKVLCTCSLLIAVGYVLLVYRRPTALSKSHVERPRPATRDQSFSDGQQAIVKNDVTVIWVVLVTGMSLPLDFLLDSLQGMGVILVAPTVKSAEVDKVLKKYNINPIYGLKDCFESNNASDSCLKNEWVWLMRQAWSLEPEVVCFSFDDVVLHPRAKTYILENSADLLNGIKFSSREAATPWCFGPKIWNRLKAVLDEYCSLVESAWDQSIARILETKRLGIENAAITPSWDLVMEVNGCHSSDGKSKACSEKEVETVTKKIVAFRARDQGAPENVVKTWFGTKKKSMTEAATMKETAQCRANVCEGFHFRQTSDKRVYINRPMDNKGEDAFIIDLGQTCVDTSKINVARGGEKVVDVLGRAEQDEFPRYQKGAFQLRQSPPHTLPKFYQKDILLSAIVNDHPPANIDFGGTTIAYVRYDYANVCFAVNDMFNLYVTLEHAPSKRMLWLDGHASGNLDDVTSDLFDMEVMRIGHMSGVKCFERLVLLPKKYLLYYVKKFDSCDLNDFVSKMWKMYNITPAAEKHDTVIIRDYYLAHPRVTKKVTRKFEDQELQDIKSKIPGAKFVRFHELSWKEQLQTIADTKTLYGVHGAGLTLGLFLDKGSSMVEWLHQSRVSTLTFENLMTWRPDVKFNRLFLKQWLTQT